MRFTLKHILSQHLSLRDLLIKLTKEEKKSWEVDKARQEKIFQKKTNLKRFKFLSNFHSKIKIWK